MNKEAIFSSGKDDWETPDETFEPLNREFNFTLDACASPENTKCGRYYTVEQDGLKQDWQGETVWCNPPYSKGKQDLWVKKCWEESKKPNTTVVMLIPARTDTDRFHRYILGTAEIRFLKGRIKFVGAENGAPFPSMVVVFRETKMIEKLNEPFYCIDEDGHTDAAIVDKINELIDEINHMAGQIVHCGECGYCVHQGRAPYLLRLRGNDSKA